jgi:hypothetical protein
MLLTEMDTYPYKFEAVYGKSFFPQISNLKALVGLRDWIGRMAGYGMFSVAGVRLAPESRYSRLAEWRKDGPAAISAKSD